MGAPLLGYSFLTFFSLGRRLGYCSPNAELIFGVLGEPKKNSFCYSIKGHFLFIKWWNAHHAQKFSRGVLDTVDIKIRHLKAENKMGKP